MLSTGDYGAKYQNLSRSTVDTDLYMNGDVIGFAKEKIEFVSMHSDCDNYRSYDAYCDMCNEGIYTEDYDTNYHIDDHGYIYCWSCYENYFRYCEQCGFDRNIEDYTFHETADSDDQVCNECISEYYEQCEDCEKHSEYYQTADDRIICDSCIDDNYHSCHECGELTHDSNEYCLDCSPKPKCDASGS